MNLDELISKLESRNEGQCVARTLPPRSVDISQCQVFEKVFIQSSQAVLNKMHDVETQLRERYVLRSCISNNPIDAYDAGQEMESPPPVKTPQNECINALHVCNADFNFNVFP